jgi:hypothetical protein
MNALNSAQRSNPKTQGTGARALQDLLERHPHWLPALTGLWLLQLCISTALLVAASTSYWAQPPVWAQALDGLLAFAAVITGVMIVVAVRDVSLSVYRRSYAIALSVVVGVLLALWIFRSSFDFNFLPGVAWRTWLILHVLPAMLSLWTNPQAHGRI